VVGPLKPWFQTPTGLVRARTDRVILRERLLSVSAARLRRGLLTVDARLAIELPGNIRQQHGLRVVFPTRYWQRPPSAFILGDSFKPRDRTRHFMDNGSCCLFLPGVDEPWIPDDSFALDAWLDQVVLFVARQIILDRLGRWPGDEWKHGFAGYDQHVRETLGDELAGYFYEHRRLAISPCSECPCGSTAAFGDCHRASFERLKMALSGKRSRRVRSHDMAKLLD
jgi:hypothetical protein